MLDKNALRGAIVAKGLTQGDLANKMGISKAGFSTRMRKGVFKSTEIDAMIEILDMANARDIFFAKQVAPKATRED